MKNRTFKIAKLIVFMFLIISIVLPIIRLLFTINIKDVGKIIKAPQFTKMILNSLFATTISTVLSVGLAWMLAWCINRSNIKFKPIFSVLFTLPMLLPSISHGMGLVLLFGDNGLVTNLLHINIGLYGLKGIILGSILYSFPVAFLMLTDVFQYEDYTVYEAAKVLGLKRKDRFKTITLPNFRKPLISVIFAVFTLIFTDYGVPLVVGGKMMTVPVYMYREVIGLMDFSKGAIIGIILLLPAIIAFIIDLKSEKNDSESTVKKDYIIENNKTRDIICYIICAITIFLICVPLFTFAYLSFVKQYPIDMGVTLENVKKLFSMGVGNYLLNSLAIAFTTSFIGMCVICFTAYLTARSKKTFSNMTLHLISMISLAIPGIVLGLSYVLFFKGSWIYGTIMILVLVNMVHFFASPYLIAYNSFSMFNEKLEDVAEVMGISRMRMLLDVYLPGIKETLIEVYSYIFVNCMVTISAVSFLVNFKNMTIALMIPQFDSQSMIEATAFISIIILIVNIILKLSAYALKMYSKRTDLKKYAV